LIRSARQTSSELLQLRGLATDGADWAGIFGTMPELPRPRQRWTVRRKAAVIEATSQPPLCQRGAPLRV
jgi:hypothetical protein